MFLSLVQRPWQRAALLSCPKSQSRNSKRRLCGMRWKCRSIQYPNWKGLETIMQVEVDKEDKTVSVVEAVHIRDREFEPFAFRINEEAMPEPVGSYLPKEKKTGRPIKGPFDPDKEIPKNVHRPALDAVFANGNISNYDDYIERLKEGYGLQGIKLGYNKAVKVATLLSDKQMVIKEGKDYAFNPEYHY